VVPERRCDIVMKGGITSGIVYARAVTELSKDYRFVNVGGTSAGAIAACVAAACQRGALDGHPDPWATLEAIPDWLGKSDTAGNTNLLRLFPPARKTRPLFALFLAAISHPKSTAPLEIPLAAMRTYKKFALLGALPGLLVLVGTFVSIAPHALVGRAILVLLLALCGVAFAVTGALIGTAAAFLLTIPNQLKKTLFGTCTGSWIGAEPKTPPGPNDPQPLTPWLADKIDEAAGKTSGEPLTFGELWGTNPNEREVVLQTFTTCLTLGRPFRVPFAPDEHFQFKPSEWKRLFPERVVTALAGKDWKDHEHTLHPLPPAEQLPVVVAARLSLSFPILLSAVPLYDMQDKQLWFSDGGICSNFPLHFFDTPLPRWPTFGLDLQDTTDEHSDPIWMPETNEEAERPPEQPVTDVVSLGSWILETAMDWHDNVTVAQPGYRDRVATIYFRPGEGGLNLNMPQDLITRLGDRGRDAGAKLAGRFTPAWDAKDAPVLSWDNHRWVRYRTALATVEPFLANVLKGWADNTTLEQLFAGFIPPAIPPGQRTYAEIAADPKHSYGAFDPGQAALAKDATEAIVKLAEDWMQKRGTDIPEPVSPSLQVNAPTPAPDLRITPAP
jgi:hypothetical protein